MECSVSADGPAESQTGLLGNSQARFSGNQTEGMASQPDVTSDRDISFQAASKSSSTPRVTAREALNMFRRGQPKKKVVETASSKAAKAILDESNLQIELKRKSDERDSLEHELRVKL